MKKLRSVDPKIYDDYYFRDIAGYTIDDHYVFRRTKKIIAETFKSGKGRVLDVGFGRGEMLSFLSGQGWACIGMDYSEAAVRKARNTLKGRKVVLKKMSVTDIDLPEEFFDLVLFLNVWEHLNEIELQRFFSGLVKILKKDGCFVAQTSPTRWQVRFGHFVMKLFDLIPDSLAWHINEQTIFSVRKTLKKFGLTGDVWLERTPKFWSSQINEKYKFLRRLAIIFDMLIDSKIVGFFVDRFPLNLFFATDIWVVAKKTL